MTGPSAFPRGLWVRPVITGNLDPTCASGTPGFVPPVANFDGDAADVPVPAPAAPVNKARKGDAAVGARV